MLLGNHTQKGIRQVRSIASHNRQRLYFPETLLYLAIDLINSHIIGVIVQPRFIRVSIQIENGVVEGRIAVVELGLTL